MENHNSNKPLETNTSQIDPRLLIPGIHLAIVALSNFIAYAYSHGREEGAMMLMLLNIVLLVVDVIVAVVLLIIKQINAGLGFLFGLLIVLIIGNGLCFLQMAL